MNKSEKAIQRLSDCLSDCLPDFSDDLQSLTALMKPGPIRIGPIWMKYLALDPLGKVKNYCLFSL